MEITMNNKIDDEDFISVEQLNLIVAGLKLLIKHPDFKEEKYGIQDLTYKIQSWIPDYPNNATDGLN